MKIKPTFPVIIAGFFTFLFVTANCIAQTSYFWHPDNQASRIDVETKEASTPSPMSEASPSLTSLPSDSISWNVTDEFIPSWNRDTASDFDITLKVEGQRDSLSWAKGGIFYTTTKDSSGAPFSLICVSKSNGVVFNALNEDSSSNLLNNSSAITLPVWLRLEKNGLSIKGYYKISESGAWTELGVQTLNASASNPGTAMMLLKAGH